MKLNCIQTDCCSGVEKNSVQTARLKYGPCNEWWVHIEPGVTGYESASVNDLLSYDRRCILAGWYCCAGTKGSWDSLLVPNAEFERLRDYLRLLQPVLELVPVRPPTPPSSTLTP